MFKWFKLINTAEFLNSELVSRKLTLNLLTVGFRDVLITRGEKIGITYEGIFLYLDVNGKNPFIFDKHAIYKDQNNDLFLGVPLEN